MSTMPAYKRHQELNCHLSNILHPYLLAVDALHDNVLADIENNLSLIQMAILKCRVIMLDYKRDHERGDE